MIHKPGLLAGVCLRSLTMGGLKPTTSAISWQCSIPELHGGSLPHAYKT